MVQRWMFIGAVVGLALGCLAEENLIANAGLELEQKSSLPEGWRSSVSSGATWLMRPGS